MANERVEFAVQDALQKTLLEAAVALEVAKQKVIGFNQSSTQGMNQVEQAAVKTAEAIRKMTGGMNEASKSASILTRLLGVAGLGTVLYGIARGLESMSTSALNLHYSAREMGMSARQLADLQQIYQRLGFSAAEATPKIAQTASVLLDMAQKPGFSQYTRELNNLGAGGAQIAATLTRLAQGTQGVKPAFEEIGRIMATLNIYQRGEIGRITGVPTRIEEYAKAQKYLKEQTLLSTDAAFEFHQAWTDLGLSLNNFKTTIGISLVGTLNQLYDTLRDRGDLAKFDEYIKSIDIPQLADRVEAIVAGVERVLASLGQFVDWVQNTWKLSQVPTEEALRAGTSGPVMAPTADDIRIPAAARPTSFSGVNLREFLDAESESNRILLDIREALITASGGGGMLGGLSGPSGTGTGTGAGPQVNVGGGGDTSGRLTWFNPKPYKFVDPTTGIQWLDTGALSKREGPHASGLPITEPGIATAGRGGLGGYYEVTLPDGRKIITRKTDVGPRGVVDINAALASQLYPGGPNTVPSGARVQARYLGRTLPDSATARMRENWEAEGRPRQRHEASMAEITKAMRKNMELNTKPIDRALAADNVTGAVNVDIVAAQAKARAENQRSMVFLPVPNSGTPQMPRPYGIEPGSYE